MADFDIKGCKVEQQQPEVKGWWEGIFHATHHFAKTNYEVWKEERRDTAFCNAKLIGNKLAADQAMCDAYADIV